MGGIHVKKLHSIVFYCILLYSIVFYCILLYSIVFYCILLYSILYSIFIQIKSEIVGKCNQLHQIFIQ
jgi:hypothetical protein